MRGTMRLKIVVRNRTLVSQIGDKELARGHRGDVLMCKAGRVNGSVWYRPLVRLKANSSHRYSLVCG